MNDTEAIVDLWMRALYEQHIHNLDNAMRRIANETAGLPEISRARLRIGDSHIDTAGWVLLGVSEIAAKAERAAQAARVALREAELAKEVITVALWYQQEAARIDVGILESPQPTTHDEPATDDESPSPFRVKVNETHALLIDATQRPVRDPLFITQAQAEWLVHLYSVGLYKDGNLSGAKNIVKMLKDGYGGLKDGPGTTPTIDLTEGVEMRFHIRRKKFYIFNAKKEGKP